MLAVHPAARDLGLGRRLKLYQREQLLPLGVESVLWTYDPLEARNAHLNFNRLGVEVEEYVEEMYADPMGGEMGSELARGIGTDRFIVRWEIAGERAVRALAGEPPDFAPFRAAPEYGLAPGAAVPELPRASRRSAGAGGDPRQHPGRQARPPRGGRRLARRHPPRLRGLPRPRLPGRRLRRRAGGGALPLRARAAGMTARKGDTAGGRSGGRTPELPIVSFASRGEWEAWLAEHHGAAAGVWLKIAKQGSGRVTVSYAEALEAALCYGWIDGQKGKLDDDFWLQRFTPRRPGSKWSQINRAKALALIEQGAMRPAGRREVERAKADGRWEAAYEAQSAATVPEDLQRALDANPRAAAFFATLDRVNRYAILYRVQDAKRPETRARRIAKFVAMLDGHERIHP